MTCLSESTLLSFRAELTKLGVLNPALGASVAMGGLGALLGGGYKYMKSKGEGADTGTAISEGLGGALVGGAGGAALGGLSGVVAPEVAGAFSRAGQRAVHAFTGWTPKGGLEEIRGGAYDAARRLEEATKGVAHAEHAQALLAPPRQGFWGRLRGPKPIPELAPGLREGFDVETYKKMDAEKLVKHLTSARGDLEDARHAYEAAARSQQLGMTNIPGYLGAIREHGLVPTLRQSAGEQWRGSPAWNKALLLGLPAYGVVSAARSQPGPDEYGEGKGERIGHQVGSLVGGVTGGATMPFLGQMAMAEGVGRLGKGVGALVDKATGQPIPPPAYYGGTP